MISISSPEILGRVLRKYRKEQGISQIEAGRKYNIAQSSISDIENGRSGVRLETLFRYMSALGLEMSLELRAKAAEKKELW